MTRVKDVTEKFILGRLPRLPVPDPGERLPLLPLRLHLPHHHHHHWEVADGLLPILISGFPLFPLFPYFPLNKDKILKGEVARSRAWQWLKKICMSQLLQERNSNKTKSFTRHVLPVITFSLLFNITKFISISPLGPELQKIPTYLKFILFFQGNCSNQSENWRTYLFVR